MRHEQTVRIDRPIGAVFAYVTDPSNLPAWDADIRSARQVSSGPMEVGAQIEIERTVPPSRRYGTFTGHVKQYEPTRSFAVSVDEGPLPFDLRYRFVEADSATDLVVSIRSHPKGLRRLMEPLVSPAVHRQIAAHYSRLKNVLEQQEHTEP
jgi:uncharacterized protein YndB with AHSA1/START domain